MYPGRLSDGRSFKIDFDRDWKRRVTLSSMNGIEGPALYSNSRRQAGASLGNREEL